MAAATDPFAELLRMLERPASLANESLAAARRDLVVAKESGGRVVDLLRLAAALAAVGGAPPELTAMVERASSATATLIKTVNRRRRSGLSRELRAACETAGVAVRQISERPELWRIGAFDVAVDRGRDLAIVRYARLPVVTGVECAADDIARACRRADARLRTGSLAPDVFVDILVRAYQAVVSVAAQRFGDRVALTALRRDACGRATGLRPGRKRAYTRAQFAYDLARLRNERRLVHDRGRIDLGVATGSATRRRSQVVWIADEAGGGQYYASFRIIPVAGDHIERTTTP